jgi:DHA1 family bicyclomycin/chloramphenicol resistance-like MFS transporter
MFNKQKKDSMPNSQPGQLEFIALMAFTMSLIALSIDAMLPAFPELVRDLRVTDYNDIQLIISLLFIGLSIGQLFYGSLSDAIGRKPAMYIGFGLFCWPADCCRGSAQPARAPWPWR